MFYEQILFCSPAKDVSFSQKSFHGKQSTSGVACFGPEMAHKLGGFTFLCEIRWLGEKGRLLYFSESGFLLLGAGLVKSKIN